MSRSFGPFFSSFTFALGLLARAASVLAAEPNAAQTGERRFGQVAIVDSDPPASSLPKKRALPDYDGRGEQPSSFGEKLLWVPRIILAPLYIATEYVVRRPLGAIVMAFERDKVAQRVLYVGSIGPRQNLGLSPSLSYDHGRLPYVGAYFWWDDAGSPKNHVRAHVATWGSPLVMAAATDRWELDDSTSLALRGSFTRRTDNVFHGLGPNTTSRTASRFESNAFDVAATFDHRYLTTAAGFRDVTYGDESCCDEPGLWDLVRAGRLPPPPRLLAGGFTSLYQSATFALDSRTTQQPTGARIAVTGAPSFDVSRQAGKSWVRYEASALGAWDITGTARTLTLSAHAMFVDPLQGGTSDIPFTELATLGGAGHMRGFLPGRLVGRSAAVATLDYAWPIWSFLDGTIQSSVGNVFDAGLKGFAFDKLRLSTVFGIRSSSSRDHVFELLTGFGTETFEQGTRATSFRLAFGATRAF